jgi:hypothetical protein
MLVVAWSPWLVVWQLQKIGMLAMQAGRWVAELGQLKLLARGQQCKAPPPQRHHGLSVLRQQRGCQLRWQQMQRAQMAVQGCVIRPPAATGQHCKGRWTLTGTRRLRTHLA